MLLRVKTMTQQVLFFSLHSWANHHVLEGLTIFNCVIPSICWTFATCLAYFSEEGLNWIKSICHYVIHARLKWQNGHSRHTKFYLLYIHVVTTWPWRPYMLGQWMGNCLIFLLLVTLNGACCISSYIIHNYVHTELFKF